MVSAEMCYVGESHLPSSPRGAFREFRPRSRGDFQLCSHRVSTILKNARCIGAMPGRNLRPKGKHRTEESRRKSQENIEAS